MPSDARVARVTRRYMQKIAAVDTINKFIQDTWLPAIGKEIVSRVGGQYAVTFDRGYKLEIRTSETEVVEIIRIRVGLSYKTGFSTMYLSHDWGGESAEVDSMDYGTFAKLWPKAIAEWAVKQVRARSPRQVSMFAG